MAILCAFQQFKVAPVLPVIMADYGYTPLTATWLVAIYGIGGFMVTLLGARRLTRGPDAIQLSLGAFVAGSVVSWLGGGDAAWMLAGRFIESLGFGALVVQAQVLMHRNASRRDAPLASGLFAVWMPAGQLVAGAFAAFVTVFADPWLPWTLGVLLCAMFMLAVARLSSAHPERFSGDHQAAAATTPVTVQQQAGAWVVGCAFALWSLTYIAFSSWITTYVEGTLGASLNTAQLAYALPVIILGIFNILAGVAISRGVPLILALLVALAVQTVCWVWAIGAGVDGAGLALLVIFGVVFGIIPTCYWSLPRAMLGPDATPEQLGQSLTIILLIRYVGTLVGPVLLVAIATAGGWANSFLTLAGLTVLSALLAFIGYRYLRMRE